MPDMIEIVQRPAKKSSTVIIVMIFLCLVAAVIWSLFAKLDSAVVARGALAPEGQIVSVRSYVTDTVRSVNCELGQYVSAGETLVEFNGDESNIQLDAYKQSISVLEEKCSYISGVLDVQDKEAYIQTVPTTSVTEQWKEYTARYLSQRAYLELSRKTLENELITFQKTNEAIIINLSDMQRELYQLELDNLMYKVEMASEQISTLDAEYNTALLTEYQNAQEQLRDFKHQCELIEVSNGHSKIVSPVDGYICTLNVNATDQVVGTGDSVLSILPADDRLVFECYISNADIADVNVSSTAKVKLDAYPFSDYGSIEGTVFYISPTAVIHEQLGEVYYAKVELITNEQTPALISGMTGTVEINTGERSVFEYFISPLVDGIDSAFNER